MLHYWVVRPCKDRLLLSQATLSSNDSKTWYLDRCVKTLTPFLCQEHKSVPVREREDDEESLSAPHVLLPHCRELLLARCVQD